jgi:uncharacterized protein
MADYMNTPSQSDVPLRPTSATEHVHALDAMRGVAILGVLLAYTVWNLGNLPAKRWSGVDHVTTGAMDVLVDNKFLTMFAFLFGLGVCQQWRRWEDAGHDPVPLHLRRMGFLIAIGLVHAALLRNGDILAPYAILGLVLLAFRRAPRPTIAIAAVLLAAAPHVVQALAVTGRIAWPARPTGAGGSYVAENLAWLRHWYLTNPLISWPRVGAEGQGEREEG